MMGKNRIRIFIRYKATCILLEHSDLDDNRLSHMPMVLSGPFNPSNAEAISFKTQRCKYLRKPSKPCNVGICWIALAEFFQMSTHLPGFQSFPAFLRRFILPKLVTSSIRVNTCMVTSRFAKSSEINRFHLTLIFLPFRKSNE